MGLANRAVVVLREAGNQAEASDRRPTRFTVCSAHPTVNHRSEDHSLEPPPEAQGLLLDVWREACRHIRIEESAAAIGELLAHRKAMSQMLVRRIDLSRCCLETAAIAPVQPDHPLAGAAVPNLARTT